MVIAALVGLGLFLNRRWHRLASAPASDPAAVFVPFILFTLMLVLELAGVQAVAAAKGIDLGGIDELPPRESVEAMTTLKVAEYCFAFPVLCAALWWQWRLRSRGLRRPVRMDRAFGLGIGALLLAWPVVASVAFLSGLVEQIVTGVPPKEIAHSTLEDLMAPEAGASVRPLIALVVVGAAVFEEVLYRALLQESIKHFARSRWLAIAGASMIFTLMHGGAVPLSALPALFALSLGLGWVYEKSDSLLPPIVAHMGFNALNIALAMATITPLPPGEGSG